MWKAYLLSGGSPIAAMEIRQRERIPEYFFEISSRASPVSLTTHQAVLPD
jgi:hypothetical protein